MGEAAAQQNNFTGFFVMDVTQYHGRTAGVCLQYLLETIRDKGRAREKTTKHTFRAAGLRAKTDYGK